MPLRSLQIGSSARFHIRGAKGNYERYERYLQNPTDIDLALVSLFYSALHLVQAHAIAKCPTRQWPSAPENHVERSLYISDHLGRIFVDYLRLRSASEDVRYYLSKPTLDAVREYHDKEFSRIVEFLHTIGITWL